MNDRPIKISFFLVFLFSSILLMGQATFIINSLPETPSEDFIYIVGDFNSWDPGDANYKLEKNAEDKWFIVMPEMDNGSQIQFKFTRGDWETVEKGASGEEIPNRIFTFGNGETQKYDILNWADQGSGGNSTAADNVSIMAEDFYMPQLNRNRRIWIYLPPDYETSGLTYPVLYMHDGQNLFDEQTSFSGEWEVDESLNSLADDGIRVPIVIGVDNGGAERINELTPWVNEEYGGGDGDLYIDFIVETLKPYVDENYRTQTGRESTGIMGSSLGGLISFYGAHKYQEVFSKAGIFSPSYWFSDSVWLFTSEMGKQENMKFYQMAGGQESSTMIPNMQAMNDSLSNLGFASQELFIKEMPNGQHNETLWRSQFSEAYLWLFSNYATDIIGINPVVDLQIIPNPVHDILYISNYIWNSHDSIEIIDMKGVKVMVLNPPTSEAIDVSGLSSGGYIILIHSENNIYQTKFIKQ